MGWSWPQDWQRRSPAVTSATNTSSSTPAIALASVCTISASFVAPRRPLLEVALLGPARRPARRAAIAVERGLAVAGHLEQVRADGGEPMVASHALIVVERSQHV